MTDHPSHIPPELVVDFDLYNVPGATSDLVSAYRAYQDGPPIFWTPRNGGHWVVMRPSDIDSVASDSERFSTRRIAIPKTRDGDPRLLPLESEGDRHKALRRPLLHALLPKAIDSKEARVRNLAIAIIEEMKPEGSCDFVADFAHRLPVEVFFDLADLPIADAETIRDIAGNAVRASDADERARYQGEVHAYLSEKVASRRGRPGNDLFSAMFESDAARALTDAEAVTFAMFVLFAGVDTTATVMAMTARALALDATLRADIAANLEDKTFLRNAVEEFIRCFHVSSSTREVAQDIEFEGVVMRQGEMVQTMPLVYGYDASRFENPDRIEPRRRFPIVHAAFGKGAHLCPGAHLARREIQIFLEEWLVRIPDFRVSPDRPPVYATGVVNAALSLHLAW